MLTRVHLGVIKPVEWDKTKSILKMLQEYGVIKCHGLLENTHMEFSDGNIENWFLALNKEELNKLIAELVELSDTIKE